MALLELSKTGSHISCETPSIVTEVYTMKPVIKLFAIDFKDHLEVKKSGNTELKYVSWAYAWAEVKKL